MLYGYKCRKCQRLIEIEKSIKESHPVKCPYCLKASLERHFDAISLPAIHYAGRPGWTYNDIKKYKNMRVDGKLLKIDPSKHGDLGSWNTNADLDKTPAKKKKR